MPKRILLFFGLLLLLIIPFGSVHAGVGERISDFKSVATLSQTNVLTATETITVDFGSIPHHGLFRNIPVTQRSGDNVYYYTFRLLSISSPTGAPIGIDKQGATGNDYQLKIGSANQTITGSQSYILSYTLTPIALQNGNVDRVNLNVTGQGWEYPIDHARLELTLPAAPLTTPVCYTGPTGATSKDCTVSLVGATVIADTTVSLGVASGMTVDMNLPTGSFSTYLVANQKPPISPLAVFLAVLGSIFWLISILVMTLYLKRALSNRRLRKNQTIVAQYEAPNGLHPGQIGLLHDSKTGMPEFTATIIDLAVRGYMKITRLETKTLGMFKNIDYRFDQLKPGSDLKDFEKAAYGLVLPDNVTDDSLQSTSFTTLSQITKPNMATANQAYLQTLNVTLEASLKTAGYYAAGSKLWARYIWSVALAAGFIAGIGAVLGNVMGFGFFAAATGLLGFAYYTLRKYPSLTVDGAAEWAKIEGFKLYLSVAEKDRINFTDAPVRTPERFNELLPYAVALGVENQWAKQFEGIDVTPTNGWYGGNGINNLGAAVFASSFAGSFASSVNSSFAGSSGSGGAGGGSGGGGGGGW